MGVTRPAGARPSAPSKTAEASQSRPGLAALWMAGAVASFTTLAVAGRAVSVDLTTFELMFWRSLIGLAILLGFVGLVRPERAFATGRLPLHLARNIAHFAAQNLWFFAIATTPLAIVFALEFTTPIWGLLLAPLILGERLTRRGLLGAAIGFAGILVVAGPSTVALSPGLVAAAACAIGFALSITMTKILTRTEPLLVILMWLHVMQAIFAAVIVGHDGHIALPAPERLHWMVLIGITGLTAHLCLTRALQSAPASLVMPMDFARLPVIAIVAMLVYGEPLDPFVLAGAALIFLGNWVNLRNRAA
jgi:drug/metabolite transporter (DMT)-like permease